MGAGTSTTTVPLNAIPVSPVPGFGHTGLSLAYLRKAVGRLETLFAIAIAVTVLTLVLDVVGYLGWLSTSSTSLTMYGVDLSFSPGTAVSVAFGLTIAVLALVALVNAIIGLAAWRRGVWNLRRATHELAGAPERHLESSLRAERQTVLSAVGLLVVAIVVGVVLGITDAGLYLTGRAMLSSVVTGLVEGVAIGAMMLLVYLYGTRHLTEALSAGAPYTVGSQLFRGRDLVLAGAIVGVVGSFSSIFWPMEVLSVAGMAMVLAGIGRYRLAFEVAASANAPAERGRVLPAHA